MGNAGSGGRAAVRPLSQNERLEGHLGTAVMALRRTYAHLALNPDAHGGLVPRKALEEHFQFFSTNMSVEGREDHSSKGTLLASVAQNLAPSLVDRAFGGKDKLDWIDFLKGTIICCKEPSGASRLNLLISVFAKFPDPDSNKTKEKLTEKKVVEEGERGGKEEGKDKEGEGRKGQERISKKGEGGGEVEEEIGLDLNLEEGWFDTQSLENFLLICWLLFCHVKSGGKKTESMRGSLRLIDVDPIIEGIREDLEKDEPKKSQKGYKKEDGSNGEEPKMPANKIASWILLYLPGLCDCLSDFVNLKLIEEAPDEQAASLVERSRSRSHSSSPENRQNRSSLSEEEANGPKEEEEEAEEGKESMAASPGLLSTGSSFVLGLSLRGAMASTLLGISCEADGWRKYHPQLLYRASTSGRGVRQLLSRVEGYRDPVLFLFSASTRPSEGEEERQTSKGGEREAGERWSMAVVLPTGLENRETFYGGSGCSMLVLQPRVKAFRPLGRESNFVYSHSRLPGARYSSSNHSTVTAVAFGGSVGRERVVLDSELETVTLRHHTSCRTYQPGGILPTQGYSPLVSSLEEVEVWGMGGPEASRKLEAYLQRETLFTEQRAKIDMKKFAANWESSPDKMMLDMVSDPNKPSREER